MEHLTSLQKRGVDALSSFSAFSYERALMYVYSDSMPLNLSLQPKLAESNEQQHTKKPVFEAHVLMIHNTSSMPQCAWCGQ